MMDLDDVLNLFGELVRTVFQEFNASRWSASILWWAVRGEILVYPAYNEAGGHKPVPTAGPKSLGRRLISN